MCLTAPSAASKSFSPWRVISVGDAALLLPAMARELPQEQASLWEMPKPPPDSRSGSWSAFLASSHRWYVSFIKGSMRPVLTGRRPERYHHLRPLPHALRKLLRLILQHGCGGIPSEARKGDLMNRLLPRWPAPHSMEPETPKPKGSQWFTSFLHDLLASHI